MEEEVLNVEQPLNEAEVMADCASETESQIDDEIAKKDKPAFDGSTSKFKTEFELKKAYENLEAEFTRKSQKLKELEKMLESFNAQKQSEQNSNVPPQESESFKSEKWPDMVAQFLENNEVAKDYAQEISEEILSDKSLACESDPLEKAWAKVASKKFVDKNKLAYDDDFIENYVLKNEKIKEKLLQEIVSENSKNEVPRLISGVGSPFAVSKQIVPKTFDEAKEELNKIFN